MRLAVLAITTTAACHGSPSAASDAAPDSPAAPIDAAADSAVDAMWVSPWQAPTGALLTGVTLADGWQDLRALSSPLEIPRGWTDSLFAMADGRHLLFAYEQTDFFDFFISNGATTTLTGPSLAGLSPATFQMFEATLGQADWQVTAHPLDAMAPAAVQASPATNQAGDVLVFTRFELPSGHSRLYASTFMAGAWTTPTALAINSNGCNDDNAKIVGELATGITIVFESTRAEPAGTSGTCATTRQLYTATYQQGTFSAVTAVAGIDPASSDDSQPFLSLDQQTLYWTGVRPTGYGVFAAARQPDGSFADLHPIALPTTTGTFAGHVTLIGEASVVDVPEGSLLYMMCGVAMDTHGGMTYHDADYIQLEPCVARRPK